MAKKYNIKYNGRSVEMSKPSSTILVYKIPYEDVANKRIGVMIQNQFIVYILYGRNSHGKDMIYVGKSKNGIEYRPKAWNFIKKQVLEGHQAYVICPKVEDSEGVELENVGAYAETLREVYGTSVRVGELHGRMKEDRKQEILREFTEGKIDVLVSTTVIEVGINNPNATVMMIENAERFGLAQLHQLRGRVGRGEAQSYCIFINVNQSY